MRQDQHVDRPAARALRVRFEHQQDHPCRGGVLLVLGKGQVAASWSFAKLLSHWQEKHAYAAYIPSLKRELPAAYWYGSTVRLGEGTDFLRFLRAMAAGAAYYDPESRSRPPTCATGLSVTSSASDFGRPFEAMPNREPGLIIRGSLRASGAG